MLHRAVFASGLMLLSLSAHAADVCAPGQTPVPLERQLRQLYLDLLGRPPTIDEYRAAQAKGSITSADIDELMGREDFYTRMKTYHRALLRSNVSASVNNNNDTRLFTTTDAYKPLEMRGNPATNLRGRNGIGCDHQILQDDCNQNPQDPHFNLGPATCRDLNGVPMPVSVDYDNGIYQCTLVLTAPGGAAATDCAAALTAGLVPEKYRFFCDNRVENNGTRRPYLCLPDPTKPTTMVLTQEQLDGQGHVVSFLNPTPVASAQFNQLDRCDLTLALRNNVRGSYAPKRGCWVREGVVSTPPPYWDKSGATSVMLCAIEAQTRATNPVTMESCETTRFLTDRSCGCGVGARRCEAGDGSVHNARLSAINEEPLLIADSVLRKHEDYFNLLTTRRSYLNSTLSELYRERQGVNVWALTAPTALDAMPVIGYTADPTEWKEYVRDENHSGVLTTPAFLYRFPTYRSRVNEFYDAFLCKHFAVPADAVVPSPEDGCNRENNLAKRCGCNYCHATIEPTGAHWGRYGERSAVWLDPARYPRYDAKCRDCALAGNTTCDNECGNYVMQAFDGDGASSLGLLKSYLYRTTEEEPNIAQGPKLLVERMLQTGDLQRCAVKKMWGEFLGRSMTTQEEGLYLENMTQAFERNGRDLKSLIKEVVTSDAYRRVD